MEQLPRISVIVPVYNVEPYLNQCVASITAQTYQNLEIILVDDGSPDRCGAMCDDYARRDARIRVIHKPNGGLSDARNAGMDIAAGRYIGFVDSDDYIHAEMLEVLYRLAEQEQAEISVCGVWDCYEGSCTPQYAGEQEQFCCDSVEAMRLTLRGGKMPGCIWNKLIRRDILEGLRFRTGKTYEDAFFTPELFFRAKRIAVTTQPLYYYWHREGSITAEAFRTRSMDVIEAYQYTYAYLQEKCPKLLPEAEFRVQWAHFVVLDKMIAAGNYRDLPQYPQVVGYLKQNWKRIAGSPYFQKSRRIAVVALRCGTVWYAMLSAVKHRLNKENG